MLELALNREDTDSPSLAAPSAPSTPLRGIALRVVGAQVAQLIRQLQAGLACADRTGLQRTAHQVRNHLFLCASQLIPAWRGLSTDSAELDQVEVRLDQLRHLVDTVLARGPDDVMQAARCAVLCDEMNRHRIRIAWPLQALDKALDAAALQALGMVWIAESERLELARRQGRVPDMDNEDADPVGLPVG
jgi:hypothetical protein